MLPKPDLSLIHIFKAAYADVTPYGGYRDDEDQGQMGALGVLMAMGPVSYTHLDVYKRQEYNWDVTHITGGLIQTQLSAATNAKYSLRPIPVLSLIHIDHPRGA